MTLSEEAVVALAVVPGVVGIAYSAIEYWRIARMAVDTPVVATGESQPLTSTEDGADKGAECVRQMNHIANAISVGAGAFLFEEFKFAAVFIIAMAGFLLWLIPGPWCATAFIIGALASIVAGWIGMRTAVMCNVRCTYESWHSLPRGFDLAVRGGSVMGIALVSIGTLVLFALVEIFRAVSAYQGGSEQTRRLYEDLAGFGLGGSSIALFGRVGGGIYTKAADVGADLAGKNEWGLEEDDYRNPACIADNVGDNVGDVAGMGADLFGSYAEATCAALVVAAASGTQGSVKGIDGDFGAMMFPLLLSAAGIVASIITLQLCKLIFTISAAPDASIERYLKGVLFISTVLQTGCAYGLAYLCLPSTFGIDKTHTALTPNLVCCCVVAGLWAGLMIGFVTEYYTSHTYTPVREVATAQGVSAATGIIFGLSLGYQSCVVPVILLGIVIVISHEVAGFFGIALAALGMLGTLSCALTIDVYGPIADNAGGIAEMSGLEENVRQRTDALDAAGNTTAAIGKGFAIGSAGLVSLALFGAFCIRADISVVNCLNAWVFSGILYGAMLPYWFSAMTVKSVGEAANDMVRECNRQFPLIMQGGTPDYNRCIMISTQASLREMILPGALVIFSPILFGIGLGKNAVAGLLIGALTSGVQLAISMSNSGGAWDNAKKYIEAGGLGEGKGKKSEPHKNAVVGDTVGDPLKDTSGPSLNVVVKLSAITALVFGSVIKAQSNSSGGPRWMSEDLPSA